MHIFEYMTDADNMNRMYDAYTKFPIDAIKTLRGICDKDGFIHGDAIKDPFQVLIDGGPVVRNHTCLGLMAAMLIMRGIKAHKGGYNL